MTPTLYTGELQPVITTFTGWPYPRKHERAAKRGLLFETSEGYVGIALDAEHRLSEANMPRETLEAAAESLGLSQLHPSEEPEPAQPLIDRIRRYFAGEPVAFDWPLNLSTLTAFQREALSICATIPYGELRSYGWIADRMDRPKSARPVGGAMGVNPIPIVIPCHRVVGSNGKLVGYGGGMFWKERLLALEGIRV